MGLANKIGAMNTKITVWKEIFHPIHPSFDKIETSGQWVDKSTKTRGKSNEEVTSFAYVVLPIKLDLKNDTIKLERGHNEDTEPSGDSWEIISLKGSPSISEVKKGLEPSEWIYYV